MCLKTQGNLSLLEKGEIAGLQTQGKSRFSFVGRKKSLAKESPAQAPLGCFFTL
jgi:hypothetical protein